VILLPLRSRSRSRRTKRALPLPLDAGFYYPAGRTGATIVEIIMFEDARSGQKRKHLIHSSSEGRRRSLAWTTRTSDNDHGDATQLGLPRATRRRDRP